MKRNVTVQPAPLAKSHFVLIGNCVAIFAHNLALSTQHIQLSNSYRHDLIVIHAMAELLQRNCMCSRNLMIYGFRRQIFIDVIIQCLHNYESQIHEISTMLMGFAHSFIFLQTKQLVFCPVLNSYYCTITFSQCVHGMYDEKTEAVQ